MKRRVGLIVNPVAGMGGRVGLKGSDGAAVLQIARRLGAVPNSPKRAVEALARLASLRASVELVTYPHEMGAHEAVEAGFEPMVIGSIAEGETTAADTEKAAREMRDLGIDLLLFAGGDGTAVNIYTSIGDSLAVVGIPTGVKMHSAVFALNPKAAGDLAAAYVSGGVKGTREAEVMDIDEQAFREGRVSAKLYGYLRVPVERTLVQSLKAESRGGEEASLEGIAWDIVDKMVDDYLYIIGPGTTTRGIMVKLGLEYTLLGVDVVWRRQLAGKDVNERQLSELIDGRKAKIVVTPIGGQGFIFGRGNQQIGPSVIRSVGRENIIVVATPGKIHALNGRPLLVDTGDDEVDEMLSGYLRVTTGYNEQIVYRVAS
ncbi:MAG: ATP-NAD kinase family protein [Chloroflexota bacterium]